LNVTDNAIPALIVATGKKVSLRARTLEDVPLLFRWHNLSGQVQRFDAPWEWTQREPDDVFAARMAKSIESEQGGKIKLALIVGPNQLPLGTVNSYGDKGNPDNRYVGISIYDDPLINRGFGTEALALWVEYLFKSRDLHHIGLETWSFNARMIRVAEKVGFKHEGREREVRQWEGQWLDKLHFGILRTEWKEMHS